MPNEYDLIVIGAGPAGEHAVGRATKAGLSTLLIETELFGGECSYWACIPSKALLRPPQILRDAAKVPGAREAITGAVDTQSALARRNWMVSDWDDAGQVQWVENTGASYRRGHARLAGERLVEVEASDGSKTVFEARRAVIVAVGSDPSFPPIPGLSDAVVWTNREATAAPAPPESLLVLGGGPVGVELAQAWKRLGTETVDIVEAESRLLPGAEPFASDLVASAFAAEGIGLRLSRRATRVERSEPGNPVTVVLDDGSEITAAEMLLAVGRRPRTNDLGVETVGLEPGAYLKTNASLQVSSVAAGWLYAIGDVNGIALLTHMGKYQARLAVRSIIGEEIDDVADRGAVPSVVFSDPQVASVGFTEAQARAAGRPVITSRVDITEVSAARIVGDGISGAAQLVVDAAERRMIGATFVGPDVADWLQAATVAVATGASIDDLRHAVPAFPTMAEVWIDLIESLFTQTKR
jgi:pyruvate/2-oxoglutarate dehydrogenase complex dihydrolipoamide dehydrogenase (E3) component